MTHITCTYTRLNYVSSIWNGVFDSGEPFYSSRLVKNILHSVSLLNHYFNQMTTINVRVQRISKLMEGGTKLGFPLDCHLISESNSACRVTAN